MDLNSLTELVVDWIAALETDIFDEGMELNDAEIKLATLAGVEYPYMVRYCYRHRVDFPVDLIATALIVGMDPSKIAGLTCGHCILFTSVPDWATLAHELKHVAQYERLGGVAKFLKTYITQCIVKGYENAPLEIEARQFQRAAPALAKL